MTILTTQNRRSYNGDGTTVAFSYPQRFLADADLRVFQRINGVETELVLGTDFTVTGAGNPLGGTVNFTVAPATGVTIVIVNDPTISQTIDYEEGGDFPADTHERGLDRLTIICQRLSGRIDRTLQYDETEPNVLSASEVIERVADAETARDEALAFATQTSDDAAQTAADRLQTGQDRSAANASALAAAGYRAQTELDAQATAADVLAAQAARDDAEADAQATAADRLQTALDRAATMQDALATSADRVQTALDAADADTARIAAELAQAGAEAASPPFAISQVTGLSHALENAGPPAGSIIWFAASTPPNGFLKANGAALSRTTYAALFAVIGTTYGAGDDSTTFNLPDLRGEFIRGFDDGRGVDSGRGFGSGQGDQNRAHTHTVDPPNTGTNTTGAHTHSAATVGTTGGSDFSSPGRAQGGSTGQSGNHAHTLNIAAFNSGSEGGSEGRPRNVALLACIKF